MCVCVCDPMFFDKLPPPPLPNTAGWCLKPPLTISHSLLSFSILDVMPCYSASPLLRIWSMCVCVCVERQSMIHVTRSAASPCTVGLSGVIRRRRAGSGGTLCSTPLRPRPRGRRGARNHVGEVSGREKQIHISSKKNKTLKKVEGGGRFQNFSQICCVVVRPTEQPAGRASCG